LKKILTVVLLASFSFLLLASFGTYSAISESFSFHNQSSFVDETKIMHVYGEIKNESGKALKDIVVTATFYDSAGRVLNKFQAAPAFSVLNPGGLSPFEIKYLDSKTVDTVNNYTLSATGSPAELKETNLQVAYSNSRLDLLGTYYINGEIRNNGQETANNTVAVATLYDKQGRVIAIGEALAEAPDGTSNIPPQSDAPFGIAVTERLQTYKTARFSLAADSDQYTSSLAGGLQSQLQQQPQANTQGGQSIQNRSGCLIATAAFGSALAPQVQDLRGFRDGIVLHTFAGSMFMNVFNAWYYSFSPSVADYERQTPWLQSIVRELILPLLAILKISASVYNYLNPIAEFGIVIAGVVASLLIGAVYFMPPAVAAGIGLAFWRRQLDIKTMKLRYALAIASALGMGAIATAELWQSATIMMAGTAMLVLSVIAAASLTGFVAAVKFYRRASLPIPAKS